MKNSYILYGVIAVIVIAGVYFITAKPSYVPLADGQHIKGSDGANVTIVEYSDFQCPFCGAAQPTIKQLMQDYEGRIRLEYRHFPLSLHENAEISAEASECASDQGKFWEYHDVLFANNNKLYHDALIDYAVSLGMDKDNFTRCLNSGAMKYRVNRDMQEGVAAGVSGTPAFFINGQKVIGNQPISVFRSAIDRALGVGR